MERYTPAVDTTGQLTVSKPPLVHTMDWFAGTSGTVPIIDKPTKSA